MTTRSTISGLRGDGKGWTLLAIASGWLFVIGGRYLVPAVLPQVKASFGVTDVWAGIAITVIWATYGLMQAPAGLLIDYLGERLLLAGSLLLTAASVLVLGAAPAFLAFIFGCVAFGLATGLYGPARGTALSRTFADRDGSAIGVTLAAGSVGSAVLPFLAGAFVGNYGWRLIVGGLGVPFTLVGIFIWSTVPEASDRNARTLSRTLIDDVLRAIRIRGVFVAVSAATVMVFVYQGLTAFLVTYLVSVKALDQTTAAAILALFFVGAAISKITSGNLADRFGHRPVLFAVAGVNVPVLVAVPFVDGAIPIGLLSLLLGTRMGVVPAQNAYIIRVLPDDITGTAWGILRTGLFVLGAGGSTVVGWMSDADLFDASFILMAALTAVAALLYAFLPDRDAAQGNEN